MRLVADPVLLASAATLCAAPLRELRQAPYAAPSPDATTAYF